MTQWLFKIGGDNVLHLSTFDTSHSGTNYSGSVIPSSFSGINLRWNIAGNGLISPNECEFEVTSASYVKSDFENKFCVILLVIDGIEKYSWKFKINRALVYYGKIKCYCTDILQEHLQGDFPNTPHPKEIWPSSDPDIEDNDTYCIPLTLGEAYIPVRCIYTGPPTNARRYVLGVTANYTVREVRTPHEWPSSSVWLNNTSNMIQSNEKGYEVLAPIIAVGAFPDDGVINSVGLWMRGNSYLDMLCRFNRTNNSNVTNPADWIRIILINFGIAETDIDMTSFTAAKAAYTHQGIVFNGGWWRKEERESVLSSLLQQVDSFLIFKEKIELHQFDKNSVHEFNDVLLGSFTQTKIEKINHDSGRVHWPEALNKPQDVFNGKTVVLNYQSDADPTKTSSEIFQARFLCGQSENAQRAGRLFFQKKHEQYERLSFSVAMNSFDSVFIFPGHVISINSSNYGGQYTAIVTDLSIDKDCKVNLTCVRLTQHIDSWNDITPSNIPVVEGTGPTFNFWDAIRPETSRIVGAPSAIDVEEPRPYEIRLSCTYTPDNHFDFLEIWAASVNHLSEAVCIGECYGGRNNGSSVTVTDHFTVTGLGINDSRWVWARIKDTFGNYSSFYPANVSGGRVGATSNDPSVYIDLFDSVITTDHLFGSLNERIDKIDQDFVFNDGTIEVDLFGGLDTAYAVQGVSLGNLSFETNTLQGQFTVLETQINDSHTGLTATSLAIDGLSSQVNHTENGLSAIAQKLTNLHSEIKGGEGTIDARFTQVQQASVDEVLGAQASEFTHIFAEFESLNSDIANKASISELSEVSADVTAAKSQYTLQVSAESGNDKYVTGISLIADTATQESSFIVQANKFQLVHPDPDNPDNPILVSPFSVHAADGETPAQVLINGNLITNGSILGKHISSQTKVVAGTGSYIATIDGENDDWRLYIGSADPDEASFKVDKTGKLHATGAEITGTLKVQWNDIVGTPANLGGDNTQTIIDGGLITTGQISLANGGGTVGAGIRGGGTGGGAIRIWAGTQTHNNTPPPPFRVTHAGKLFATDADITGKITATSGSFTGRLTSNDATFTSGTIAGIIFSGNSLHSSTSTQSGFGMSTTDVAIWCGSNLEGKTSAKFRVTQAGVLTATDANITGKISINDSDGFIVNSNGKIRLKNNEDEVVGEIVPISNGMSLCATDGGSMHTVVCIEPIGALPFSDGAKVLGATNKKFLHVATYLVTAGINILRLTGSDVILNQAMGDDDKSVATKEYVDSKSGGSGGFPAGTQMIFRQSNAPVGWTKITNMDDMALRVVSGNVGSRTTGTAFSAIFSLSKQTSNSGNEDTSSTSSSNTGSTTLTSGMTPSHSHMIKLVNMQNNQAGSTGTKISIGDWYPYTNIPPVGNTATATANTQATASPTLGHAHTMAHTHTGPLHRHTYFTNVNYVDVIIAKKN